MDLLMLRYLSTDRFNMIRWCSVYTAIKALKSVLESVNTVVFSWARTPNNLGQFLKTSMSPKYDPQI